ncbi:Imm52 family immunity protein [Agrobacterium salinitolerans]|uniref:Immunity protein 52 domain-containing protein n=1 Tax=Agrobacterium tumefaciens TaxID=358 RepID=A0A2L2LK91_AGRTU|nr:MULTISPECIES: Imm52 family immunity protein [Agrobacterium]AVH44753.1 hypothetical protein At1D1609_47120 [Agrobacterium tumefaciens]NSY98656.1 hypothetical protein [Agrobacterium tumefaciens]NTE84277.1 hypothetical protein [Agrobacterium tumefaciens]RVT69783.1 hypothetical protein EM858_26370 [Agrobacterium sp. CNPSo 2736]WLD99221.1 hypothetical protein PX860_19245 [Agrobacterium leguminum]
MESYFAAAYWSSRKETLEECTRRATCFLANLAGVSDTLRGWREKSKSRKKALTQKMISIECSDDVRVMLEKGRNRRDMDRSIIEELGFGFGLWNGEAGSDEAGLSVRCGIYNASGVSNAVVLNLPRSFDPASGKTVLALARSFIDAWEPESFVLTTNRRNREELIKAEAKGENWQPFLDVALYLQQPDILSFKAERGDLVYELNLGRLFLSRSLSPAD